MLKKLIIKFTLFNVNVYLTTKYLKVSKKTTFVNFSKTLSKREREKA